MIRSAIGPFLLGLLAIAGRAGAQAPAAPPAPSIERADVGAWLDGLLPFALRTGDIPGAVAVVVKDERIVATRAYGLADVAARRPIDPDRTLFRVGSLSKLVTWTAVMQLVQAGALDLDADVDRYLDFRIPPYRGRPVTLRQLMTHTAGFDEVGKDTIVPGGPPIALDLYLKRSIPARVRAPGTTPSYSNWGAALAGYIVQRTSGLPFETYVETRIFRPLGMGRSSFRQPLPPALAAAVARGYRRASGPPLPFEMVGPGPAGGLSATATDMARFMIAHLDDGGAILSPPTTAAMHASPLDRVDPRSLIPPLDRAELGFLDDRINGHAAIGHRGATQAFHTLLELFPADHVGLFVSLNGAGRDDAAEILLDQIHADFADRYFPAPRPVARIDPAAGHAGRMAGLWQISRGSQHGFLALAGLFGQTRVTADAAGRLSIPSIRTAAGVPATWDEIAPFVWAERDGHRRLAAQRVGGEVVRWAVEPVSATAVYDRVPFATSSAWILPALELGLAIVGWTALAGPIGWAIRRYHGLPPRHGARALCLACWAVLAMLAGWIALLAAMLADFGLIGGRSDGRLWLLQIGTALALGALIAVASRGAWRDRRPWPVAVLLAAAVLCHVAWRFGLLAMSVTY